MIQLTKYNSVFRALSSHSISDSDASYPIMLVYKYLSKHRKQIYVLSYRIIILEETLKVNLSKAFNKYR